MIRHDIQNHIQHDTTLYDMILHDTTCYDMTHRITYKRSNSLVRIY